MRVKTEPRSPGLRPQRGFALIALLAILATGMLYFLVGQLDAGAVRRRQDEVTAYALAEAKAGLIGYAVSVSLPAAGNTNPIYGKRPGDLPCADSGHDGLSDNGGIGRLPWKTLGLDDLRDGSGERLWYAVSSNFKNCSRTSPLNSDTQGTISVWNPNGSTLYDASLGNGVVAVIIAPEAPLVRQGGGVQDRSSAGEDNAINYLDIAFGQDNAVLLENAQVGFIKGPVIDYSVPNSPQTVVNDRIIVITRDELLAAVQKRVVGEIKQAMNDYFAIHANLPNPALFTDTDCVPAPPAKIPIPKCITTPGASKGRIPADSWTGTSMFLNGSNYNWFQINGWRESIYYYVSPSVASGTAPPPTLDSVPVCVTIIAGGKSLVGLPRPSQILTADYFEGSNAAGGPAFVSHGAALNDTAIGFCPLGVAP